MTECPLNEHLLDKMLGSKSLRKLGVNLIEFRPPFWTPHKSRNQMKNE